MTGSRIEDYERLAKRIQAGEAVFFVGAGFSLDSEDNTAYKLIYRLLRRFLALTGVIEHGLTGKAHSSQARDLRAALATTFGLEGNTNDPLSLLVDKNIKKLEKDYYSINDWMCNAFSLLLQNLERRKLKTWEQRIIDEEEHLIRNGGDTRPISLDLARIMSLTRDPSQRGKAMFLDAMGFADSWVMAGDPDAGKMKSIETSYEGRLLERHFVLAWLAREGLCPVLVTTNYDLLLEGAYLLSGMSLPDNKLTEQRILPKEDFEFFSPISGAIQFFSHPGSQRTARILKIHGCVREYRTARGNRNDPKTEDPWRSVLPSMVFTYREIQNWRDDAWSRDYLSTLLRTNTMIFCGYSGADPVLHDTFRGIYEEMGHLRRFRSGVSNSENTVQRTPAYFLGIAGTQEFHGLEILRAASAIYSDSLQDLAQHRNYLQFHVQKDNRTDVSFPTLDEVLLWIFHRVIRRIQRKCLETDLKRLGHHLLGHPFPPDELQSVQRRFDSLCEQEIRELSQLDESTRSRRIFRRIIGWTRWFRAGYMRELALGEALTSNPRPGLTVEGMRNLPWYIPSLGHEGWNAWGVVLEMALRRMIAIRRGSISEWAESTPFVEVVENFPLRVQYARDSTRPDLTELRIGSEVGMRSGSGRYGAGSYRRSIRWQILPALLPWITESPPPQTPVAETLWIWVCCGDRFSAEDTEPYLGTYIERRKRA